MLFCISIGVSITTKTKDNNMADTGCYACIHLPVCKFFNGFIQGFPYKSDDEIRKLITSVSEAFSKACCHHQERCDCNSGVKP